MNTTADLLEDWLFGPGRRLLWRIPPGRGLHRQLVAQIRVTTALRRQLAELVEDVPLD